MNRAPCPTSQSKPRSRWRRWTALPVCLVALCASVLPAAPAFGEGSVDLATGEPNRFRNGLAMQTSGGASVPVRYTVLRVYARAGETIQMGHNHMQAPSTFDNILVYPPGTSFAGSSDPTQPAPLPADPVFGTDIFDCNTDDPGTGRIATRAQELAGPEASPDANPDTWTACEFTAPADGIYPIVMMPQNPGGGVFAAGTVSTPATVAIGGGPSMWDVTVRNAGVVQPGRLFTHRLALTAPISTTLAPNPVTYLYTPAGYAYRVSFFNHNGQVWDLAASDRGVVDATTGERTFASFQYGVDDVDETLTHAEAVAPHLGAPDLAADTRFPIFFRPVDPVAISGPGGLGPTRGYAAAPLSPSGALTGLSFSGAGGEQGGTAQGSGGTIHFSSPPQMDGLGYTVEIDIDGNGAFGDADDVVDDTNDLNSAGGNGFAWDGRDASGATPGCGSYAYRVRSTLAEAHFTMSDVESSGGMQIERLSLPSDPALGDPFAASYDDVDPYKGSAVTDASPVAVNQGTSGPTFHAWTVGSTPASGTGNGDFVDTWMRLPEVVASGTLEVRCAQDPPTSPPSEQPPGSQPPATRPPSPQPPTGDRDETNRPKPQLRIRKTVDRPRVRAGEKVTFRITVRNPSGRVLRNVRVCDRPPAGLAYVGASPKARVSRGAYCWTVKRLAARGSRSFRLTVRALPGASGRKVAPVAASSPDARTGRAMAALRVVAGQVAAGGVTG